MNVIKNERNKTDRFKRLSLLICITFSVFNIGCSLFSNEVVPSCRIICDEETAQDLLEKSYDVENDHNNNEIYQYLIKYSPDTFYASYSKVVITHMSGDVNKSRALLAKHLTEYPQHNKHNVHLMSLVGDRKD